MPDPPRARFRNLDRSAILKEARQSRFSAVLPFFRRDHPLRILQENSGREIGHTETDSVQFVKEDAAVSSFITWNTLATNLDCAWLLAHQQSALSDRLARQGTHRLNAQNALPMSIQVSLLEAEHCAQSLLHSQTSMLIGRSVCFSKTGYV